MRAHRGVLAGAALVVLTASAAEGTTAPSARPAAPSTVDAQVLEVTGEVLDLSLTVATLDGSTRDVESQDEVAVELAADVFFAFGSADLTPAAGAVLTELVDRLRAEARGQVSVVGHTDAVGEPPANLALSQRRAEAVVLALQPQLSGADLTLAASGVGEAQPVAPNAAPDGADNPAGRQLNRRVSVTFQKRD